MSGLHSSSWMNGKDSKRVGKLFAGDLGAVVKLKTRIAEQHAEHEVRFPVILPPIGFPEPVISMSICGKIERR